MSDPAACLWCRGPFEPHRGGSPQIFCRAACKNDFHRAARQWCERAIAEGRLTIDALRDGLPAAYTLPECEEAPPPDSALSEPMARFLVEVSYHTIEMLVRFGWLREDQQDDLFAIIDALKRFGREPSALRIA